MHVLACLKEHFLSACANVCKQMGIHHYLKYLGVQARSDDVIISRIVTKLDCCLPTMPVQRLYSLQGNSFEIELELEHFFGEPKALDSFPGGSLGTMYDG